MLVPKSWGFFLHWSRRKQCTVCVGNGSCGCHNFTGSVIQIWSKVISLTLSFRSFVWDKKTPTTLCVKSCLSCSFKTLFLRCLLTKPRRREANPIPSDVLAGSGRTPCCSAEKRTNLILMILQAVYKRHTALSFPITVFRCPYKCECCINRLVNDSILLMVISVYAPLHRQEVDSPKGDVHPDDFPPASEPVCALSAEPKNQQKSRI